MIDGSFPPYSYDDDLIDAARRDGQTRVRVYRLTDTVVVVGSGSRPEAELHLDACGADGVAVLRRRGGGCAVVLDPGNVIVSVVATGLPFGRHRQHFDMLTSWLIDGLDRIGIPGIAQAGICDLVLDDRKVGGACLHRRRDLLYYSASLLVDPDLNRISRYLKHPPREPDYRRSRPHATFLGTLGAAADARRSAVTGNSLDAEQIAARLRRVLRPPDLRASAVGPPTADSSSLVDTAPLGAA